VGGDLKCGTQKRKKGKNGPPVLLHLDCWWLVLLLVLVVVPAGSGFAPLILIIWFHKIECLNYAGFTRFVRAHLDFGPGTEKKGRHAAAARGPHVHKRPVATKKW